MEEKKSWEGFFIVEKVDIKTRKIKSIKIIKNTIMNIAFNRLILALKGEQPNLEIKYLAIGTSTTPITRNDTQLGNEILRVPVSAQSTTGVGEITTDFVLLDNEAVGTIEELGIFAGSDATEDPNTGTLISRILMHEEKSDSEEINIKRIDRISD